MSDLRNILKEEYKKKEEVVVSPASLMEMIEQLMGVVPLNERTSSGMSFDTQQMTLSMIPEIAVSEIGWSDVTTTAEGEVVQGPQRQLLEGYLNNIAGTTLAEKLTSLDDFYQQGYKGITENAEESRADMIRNVLSYLVFYKTLTTVITNFNASSAGFSFESFLATLLKGTQVPANTGTIADFITGTKYGGEYISLKLYQEGSLEVGGSFSDLVDDLVNDKMGNKMRYLVVLKNLRGSGLKQRGALTFYTFEFTLENVANIIAATNEKHAKCIIFPLIPDPDAPGGARLATPGEEQIPGRIKVTPEDFNSAYKAKLQNDLAAMEVYPDDLIDLIVKMPEFTFGDGEYLGKGTTGIPVTVARAAIRQAATGTAHEEQLQDTKYMRGITTALNRAIGATDTELKKVPQAARKAAITQVLPQFKRITYSTKKRKGSVTRLIKESRDWYNAQEADDETKKQALRLSNGYLNTLKFSMNKGLATSDGDPTNAQNLGVIKVGAEFIETMLNQVRDILNEQIFEIFTSLKDLSESLNSYFASGLKDDTDAKDAIGDAENIQSKTEEVRQVEK